MPFDFSKIKSKVRAFGSSVKSKGKESALQAEIQSARFKKYAVPKIKSGATQAGKNIINSYANVKEIRAKQKELKRQKLQDEITELQYKVKKQKLENELNNELTRLQGQRNKLRKKAGITSKRARLVKIGKAYAKLFD